MRSKAGIAALVALVGLGMTACGGKEPPPPPPIVEETVALPDADSLAAAEAARLAAAASQLCTDAMTAVANGDYERAKSLLERAMREFPGTECAEKAGGLIDGVSAAMTIAERIHFEFDRSRITDEAAAVLQRKAEVFRAKPDLKVTIAGHCDERGSLEYNQALGQRRAESARRYLVNLGLPASMFSVVSYGEERPIAQGENESAWAQNRRDEFSVTNMDVLLPR
jgi:peptidoglycan-associated lipoprotein